MKLLEIAKSQLGVEEKPRGSNWGDPIAAIGTAVENVAADVRSLAQQAANGLTESEATAVLEKGEAIASAFEGIKTGLESLAAETPDDPAPVEPTV